MQAFRYLRPATVEEALGLLEEHGDKARLLAGGTDLVIELRNRWRTPEVVVDLKRIEELRPAIRVEGNRLVITAGTVMGDLEKHPMVLERFPALAEAAAVVGSVQIRNRATLAGNICNGSPAADTTPPLLVYGAEMVIASRTARGGSVVASSDSRRSTSRPSSSRACTRPRRVGPSSTSSSAGGRSS